MSKIIELAIKLSKQFETGKRNDGKEYLFIREDDKYSQWMQDVIFAGHLDRFPNDSSYEACQKVIDEIAELDANIPDDEIIDNLTLEPDIYTANLTSWLASDINNVYYLEDAISNGAKDGFQVLAWAQADFYRETAQAIIDKLIEVSEAVEV